MALQAQEPETKAAPPPAVVSTIAAIDIGANSTRLAIAEVFSDGQVELLEEMVRASGQGHDCFRRGLLSARTMRAVVAILREFKRTLNLYHVQRVRAVATSAVREATNRDLFLDRVFMATGIEVEVIHAAEESRLTVSAVRQDMGKALGKRNGHTLVAEVGGGSTLLTLLQGDEIQSAMSLPLGAIRMQEALDVANEPPKRVAEILRNRIDNVLKSAKVSLPFGSVDRFISTGGDMRFAARQIGTPAKRGEPHSITRAELDALLGQCASRTPEELAKKFGLPFADAETLTPALLVNRALLQISKAKKVIVASVTMRDGLLLELARNVTGQEDPMLNAGVLHSAASIAEKYRADMDHATHVASVAVRLFDALRPEHGLDSRERLLLEVAGILHEIGGFVSNRGHHKHSFYLVANSEVFGLSREELLIVAHTCRYHRRSAPRPSHLEYMSLTRRQRMVVNRLAAILRVADALDRGHARIVRDLQCEHKGDEFVITVQGVADLTLERRAVASKDDLFEEIYGLRIRLEEGSVALRAQKADKTAE